MSNQCALTLLTPVLPVYHEQIAATLKCLKESVDKGTFKQIESLGTIHYFRLVLLEDKISNAKTNLLLSSDYDGNEDEHIMLLATHCGDLIDQLYECCEGYHAAGERTPENRAGYLKKWSNKVAAFYIGAPGRSLKQVRQESDLRNYIWDFLRAGKWDGKTAKEVHSIVRKYVFENQDFSWTKEKIDVPKVKRWNFALLYGIAFILLPLTFLLALVAVTWLVVLHFFHEKKDKPLGLTPSQVDSNLIRTLEESEDFQNQNQFTQIISMKPGKMRNITVKALMIYARFRCYNEFVKGELMGIPTIHFARWVLLDDDKQMLFLSNFDGSWQQYLGDFIDKSGWGLTAIFSNTENFPVSRYLFWGGAYDEEHFLAWSRYYQVPSQVWYSAYPKLSIKNINTNTFIRSELIRDLNEQQAQTFLNRF